MLRSFCFACLACLFSCRQNNSVTIVFGGDVMLDRGVGARIKSRGIDYFLDGLRPEFNRADFVLVNLECPATTVDAPLTKKYIFKADPELLPALREAGITHGILANNHSYDHGRKGLISTAENLYRADIVPVGYGTTQPSACEPVILKKGPIQIAVFSSVTLPLESWMYLHDAPGMCQATVEDLAKSIAAYKATHPDDPIIVTLHWGVEYLPVATSSQRDQAKALVEAGADVIIGHHPHVVQRYEKINGKPVFYSIGNLIFDNPNPATHRGMLVKLHVTGKSISSELIPYTAQDLRPVLQSAERKWF